MANLNQKIEIVSVHQGTMILIVTGFLGGHVTEWRIDRTDFKLFVDEQGNRGWVVGYQNGETTAKLIGRMTWEEYFEDIRAVEEDSEAYIKSRMIDSSTFFIHKY